jgi:hypothetical protein
MSLPLNIFESQDLLQPLETNPFDHQLLRARTFFYEYVSATTRSQWQVEEYIKHDIAQIAIQHERETSHTQQIMLMDPVQNDLDSRIAFALARHTEEVARATPPSRTSTPLSMYPEKKRYSKQNPPQTIVKFVAEDGIKSGWLADVLRGQLGLGPDDLLPHEQEAALRTQAISCRPHIKTRPRRNSVV